MGAAASATGVPAHGDGLGLALDVLKEGDGAGQLPAVDGLGGLAGVLERNTQVGAAGAGRLGGRNLGGGVANLLLGEGPYCQLSLSGRLGRPLFARSRPVGPKLAALRRPSCSAFPPKNHTYGSAPRPRDWEGARADSQGPEKRDVAGRAKSIRRTILAVVLGGDGLVRLSSKNVRLGWSFQISPTKCRFRVRDLFARLGKSARASPIQCAASVRGCRACMWGPTTQSHPGWCVFPDTVGLASPSTTPQSWMARPRRIVYGITNRLDLQRCVLRGQSDVVSRWQFSRLAGPLRAAV